MFALFSRALPCLSISPFRSLAGAPWISLAHAWASICVRVREQDLALHCSHVLHFRGRLAVVLSSHASPDSPLACARVCLSSSRKHTLAQSSAGLAITGLAVYSIPVTEEAKAGSSMCLCFFSPPLVSARCVRLSCIVAGFAVSCPGSALCEGYTRVSAELHFASSRPEHVGCGQGIGRGEEGEERGQKWRGRGKAGGGGGGGGG